jgi:hypothetical protein
MIIVQLTGGLGNQLFQFAFGKTLAIKNNCKLKLDMSMFDLDLKREYSLAPFTIDAEVATKSECNILKGENLGYYDRVKKKIFYSRSKIIQEQHISFSPANLTIQKPAYLIGYWQSEKYFIEFKKQIFNSFQICLKPSVDNQSLLDRIESCNAISLHVRRGDFIQEEQTKQVHGSCSMEYYQKAIEHISNYISDPVFFIFSDDIQWVYQNLNLQFTAFIVDINNGKSDYEDLRLMSKCKHHILANSSFSWWGAWLNQSEDKIVIAPKIWFADERMNNETSDLIPEEWIRI